VKSIIANLNKRFDNKVRLGLMSLLMVDEWVDFSRMKELLELTDGRLASHLKVLEEEGFLTLKKEFIGRRPKTSYKATKIGKKAFNDHLKALEALLKSMD